MIIGYKLVMERIMKEKVANDPATAIVLNPNIRPFLTIQVILPPNLSPSISGIWTAVMNNN